MTDIELEIEDMIHTIPGMFVREKGTGELWIVHECDNEGFYRDEAGAEYDSDNVVVKRYLALEYSTEDYNIPDDGLEVPDVLIWNNKYEMFDINDYDDNWESGCSWIRFTSEFTEEWDYCKKEDYPTILKMIKNKRRVKKLKKINNL